jgi:hypothetical protein
MAQGASRGPRVHSAARPHQAHCAPPALPAIVSTRVWRHPARWLAGSKCKLLESRRLPYSRAPAPGPGEDSTGAGAEREWGFDPQSKAELAQGEYEVQRSKGSTGTTTRAHVHGTQYTVHTAQPWGGWPGGVPRTQRTTQPSWMCSFDGI